jgi:hypothetical protein
MKAKLLINDIGQINSTNILNFLESTPLADLKDINPPITFNKEGFPTSYWNDAKWIFEYSKFEYRNEIFSLNFQNYSYLNDTYFTEFKYLILFHYHKHYKKYVNSEFIRYKILHSHVFIKACNELNYSSICELNDDLKFIQLMNHLKGKYTFTTLAGQLSDLRLATHTTNPSFKFNVNLSSDIIKNNSGFKIKDLAVKYSSTQSEDVNQTLYIPNNVHSKLVAACIECIEQNINILDNIMAFLEDEYLLYHKIKEELQITQCKNIPRKIQSIKKTQIKILLKKHNISHFSSLSALQKQVQLLATACSILILNFSGMRMNELMNIKSDGFKVINSDPTLYVIRSFETKISGGQVVDYITSPIVKDAFTILEKIHSLPIKYDKSINSELLFIRSYDNKLLTYGNPEMIGWQMAKFTEEFNIVCDSEDVKESELLNGPRKEIKVNQAWPLKSHQFRRTLIVNFVSHRLGTINAVKQQVKHMYATMTEYYAKNSKLAETFNLNVVKEICDNIEEELLNEGVKQYKQFYYTDDNLSGIKGQAIMEERKISKVLSDAEIKQLFRSGLYKISKSMYGYCTKGNLCDKKEAIDPTFCGASCGTMIITKENALNWQKLYFRNTKLLKSGEKLVVGGIATNAAKTTMQSQNEVAKNIMNDFNMKYEE